MSAVKVHTTYSLIGRMFVLLAFALGTSFPALHTIAHADHHGHVHSCQENHGTVVTHASDHEECSFCLNEVVLATAVETTPLRFVPPYCAPQHSAFPSIAEIRRAHGLLSTRGPPALI